MRILSGLLALALSTAVFAADPNVKIDRKTMARYSAGCQRILLVDVREVKVEKRQVDHGIESSTVSSSGAVVEVIRGEHEGTGFRMESGEMEVVDSEQANAHYSASFRSILGDSVGGRTADRCVAGRRYLFLTLGDLTFHCEIAKGDDTWRDEIQELEKDGAAASPAVDERK